MEIMTHTSFIASEDYVDEFQCFTVHFSIQ